VAAEAAEQARAMLGRLGGSDVAGLKEAGSGTCGECGRDVRMRYAFGSFELCRRCAGQRCRLGARAVTVETEPQP
jgi:hypothetical protein